MRILVLVVIAWALAACASDRGLVDHGLNAQAEPANSWRSPYECYTDNGQGRLSPCSIIP